MKLEKFKIESLISLAFFKRAINWILLFIVYFIVGKFGLSLAFINSSVTAVWPVAGIALALILIQGYWVWPSIFVGAFLVNFTTAGGVLSSLSIATGNTLEAVVGAYLVIRFAKGPKAFYQAENVFKFAFLAGLFSTTISATIGVTTLCLTGFAHWVHYGPIWLTWWLGDSTGILIVAPLLMLWRAHSFIQWNIFKVTEVFFLFLISFVVSLFVFGNVFCPYLSLHENDPVTFLCAPFLMWAAFRFGQRETILVSMIFSSIAIWETIKGVGPFVRGNLNESLLLLQAFNAVNIVMALAIAAIVSQRKHAEEELKQTNEELKRLSKIRSEFTTMVTHELRTPLTSIKGGIDIVLKGIDGPVTESQVETLQISRNNVDRLSRFINDVLNYSGIESGKMKMVFEKVDMNQMMKEVYKMMESEVYKKNITLTFENPQTPIITVCDVDKIKHVILNLVHNAMKFTNAGGKIKLTLSTMHDTTFIKVEDNGIGIGEEDQKRIFELFSQVKHPGMWHTGGSGVGLTVCKLIVEQHKGKISVRSNLNKGSQFTISIPQNLGE